MRDSLHKEQSFFNAKSIVINIGNTLKINAKSEKTI